MEFAAPDADTANVLHERRDVVKDRALEFLGEARDFDVGQAVHPIEILQDILRRRARNDIRLAAIYAIRIGDKTLIPGVDSFDADGRVVKAAEREFAPRERRPILQVVAQVNVERQIVFEQEDKLSFAAHAKRKRVVHPCIH